ncbi:hypothetical protein C7B80_03265 [Cyanosarcina cf. burmensis CCALA 770]|nr:hypothetical protein C7B80_03265 [Cyanosarcina cf. burmensis CCALA 770]
MAVRLTIQADVIDIGSDMPQPNDIFLVDTNVWYWQTYTNATVGIRPSRLSQINQYLTYFSQALSSGAVLTYSGLSFAELVSIIEKSEYEIYKLTHGYLELKEYRHNQPAERANVVAEVQLAWSQVQALAVPVDLTVNDTTINAALTRFSTQALDGYDLMILEAIGQAGTEAIKVITDDSDYATVPDIQVFTSNNSVITAARLQGKLLQR